VSTILYILLAALLGTSVPAEPKGAAKVNQVLVTLKAPKASKNAEKFLLSETEINEFIQVAIKSKQRLGIKSIQLDLNEKGQLRAIATINMDEVKVDVTGTWLFKKVLSGTQVLKAEGKLVTARGKGHYELDKAEFNGVWVPAWLAGAVVGFVGKKQPPHIDVTEEFALPYGITDVVLHSDRLEIVR